MKLHIDIETYSDVDLKECGVYAYTESPNFEILLFAFAVDNGATRIIDIAQGEQIPDYIFAYLTDDNIIKTAFNANFERICIAKFFKLKLSPHKWECSAVLAATMGLPRDLEGVCKALKLPSDKQKMKEGKDLIRYFCVPCKPTKKNGGRTRNYPEHDLAKWELFKTYNGRDVDAEKAVDDRLRAYPLIPSEKRLWELDQKINDYGVRIDLELVDKAIELDTIYRARLMEKAVQLTGLDNPNSVEQIKAWLSEEHEIEAESLTKDSVSKLIKSTDNQAVKQLLEIRQMLAKTSVKKYGAMARSVNMDGRVRGMFVFYGANRTGRWSGKIVQLQNLIKNELKDLDLARTLLKEGRFDDLELLYGDVFYILSQLIRTAFIPSPGRRFIVSDFSAIEARVLAWLAGEKWRLDVFASHGKIYEASAAQMFRVPIETIAEGQINYHLRGKGKIAELALGYGGSVGALTKMGALKYGLTEEELPDLVEMWRAANKNITSYWWKVGNAVINAISTGREQILPHQMAVNYSPSGRLFIRLPSKRSLVYDNARLEVGKYDRLGVVYDGVDQERKIWGPIDTYGPKLVENITQAVARDCLANSMTKLDRAGYDIAFTVHDEVVLDVPNENINAMQEVTEIMGQPIDWAKGLILTAKPEELSYYRK